MLVNCAYLHIIGNIFSRDHETQNGVYHTVLVNTARLLKGVIWLVKVKSGFQIWKFNKKEPQLNAFLSILELANN